MDRIAHDAEVSRGEQVGGLDAYGVSGFHGRGLHDVELAARRLPHLQPLGHGVSVVVIRRGAPEVGPRTESVGEVLDAVHGIGRHRTAPAVEYEAHARRRDGDPLPVVVHSECRAFPRHVGLLRGPSQRDLSRGDLITCGNGLRGFARGDGEIGEILPFAAHLFGTECGEDGRFLRREAHVELLFAHGLSVAHEAADETVLLRRCEVESVGDAHAARSFGFEPEVLLHVLHLRERRMRRAVGQYEAVAAEVPVAGGVFPAEIPSVGPERASLGVVLQQALVHPVPEESALQVGIAVDRVPLSDEVSGRVAHRMSVLRRHHGPVAALASDLFQPSRAGILRNVHVRIPLPLRPFVIDRPVHPGAVGGLRPKVGLVEVVSVSGLVS